MTPLFLSFLFLLSRILHLLFWFFPRLFPDELLQGTITKELIEGLKIPFFDYVAAHYCQGNLVYGLLTVPFFLLFGKTVFSLRLIAILFQYGSFIAWFFFMKRFFGKKPALYTALLYLFPPPWFSFFSMFAYGAHSESLLFTAGGLFLLYKILYQRRHSLKDSILLGLVCGFGTYFTYEVFVSVISFVFLWLYHDQRMLRKKEFIFFLLFFWIGFSPWFLYNSLYQFHGMDLIRDSFIYSSKDHLFVIPLRFLKLFILKILGMLSFNYRDGNRYHPHITFLNFIYYAVIFLSYLILYCFERNNRKTYFLFLFPLLFLSIVSVSRFYITTYSSPYLVPLFPFFFAVIGLGLSRLGSLSRVLHRVSLFLLLVLLTMGVKGELNLVSPKDFKISLRYRGYSYNELGWALSYRYLDDLNHISDLGNKVGAHLSHSERFAFYYGLSNFECHLEKVENIQKYLPWVKQFNPLFQPFFLRETGRVLGLSEGNFSERIDYLQRFLPKEDQPYLIEGLVSSFDQEVKGNRLLTDTLREMRKLSPENQRALVYALGKLSWRKSCDASFLEKIKRQNELEQFFPKHLLLYYRGLGALMADSYDPLFREWPFPLEGKLEGIGKDYQEAVYWGAGFEAPLLYEDPFEYERMLKGIPTPYQPFFKQGLQDRLEWGGRNYWIEGREGLARREK